MMSFWLLDTIGDVDADLVERASQPLPVRKTKPLKWMAAVAAVLVVALGVGLWFGHGDLTLPPITPDPITPSQTAPTDPDDGPGIDGLLQNAQAETLTKAVYPAMAPYPQDEMSVDFLQQHDAWRADKNKQRAYQGAGKDLDGFFRSGLTAFLSDAGSENRTVSPLNIYMALSMLAEISDGATRQQILDALGVDNLPALRSQAHAVWNANYNNDGAVTSILGSSLWLNNGVDYDQATLDTLSEYYYASVYRGEMGDATYDAALQNWLNEQTGGLLKDQVEGIQTDPNTVMTLLTTIYFRCKWEDEFSPDKTVQDTFHGATGDVTADFMKRTNMWGTYYWGDRFSAAGLKLQESGTMWFVLPDEGVTPDDLLTDSQALSFLLSDGNYENQKSIRIHYAVPKFDVSSQMDLKAGLSRLGVTDCFDSEKADFSPLTDTFSWVDRARHGARVAIDEEGVTAAAYTEMQLAGSPIPPENEVDFVLDRPFLFVITGEDGLPLFAGVVNQL